MKNIRIFYLKIFIFMVAKFSVYSNRHVFVMNFITHTGVRFFAMPDGIFYYVLRRPWVSPSEGSGECECIENLYSIDIIA